MKKICQIVVNNGQYYIVYLINEGNMYKKIHLYFIFVSREAVLYFETGLIDKMIGPLLRIFTARYINEQVINSHNSEVEASDPPRI